MVARFSGCAVVTHWLPHTPVQIFFVLFWCIKKIGAVFFFFLTIQTEVFAVTFHITLLFSIFSSFSSFSSTMISSTSSSPSTYIRSLLMSSSYDPHIRSPLTNTSSKYKSL